jgi:hypothetical protein
MSPLRASMNALKRDGELAFGSPLMIMDDTPSSTY